MISYHAAQHTLIHVCLVVSLALVFLPGCPEPKKPARPQTKEKATGANPVSPLPPTVPQRGPLAQKILYDEAKSLLRAEQATKAEQLFRRAIAADAKGELLANCYLGLGTSLAEQKKLKEAVTAYRRVVQLRPADAEAYRSLAIGLEEAGDLQEAKLSLAQALTLDPAQLSAYQDLAGLYLREKDTEGAKRIYLRYELKRTELITVLGVSKNEEQRVQAAAQLGEAKDEATAKALGLALTDSSYRVRQAVIIALGQQGLAAGAGPLKEMLAHTDDPEEKRLIQQSIQAIASAPQPSPTPAPAPAPVEAKTK